MPIYKTSPNEILKKSIEVFRKKGYYQSKMSDLARATGLSKGVFYHHFKSKEEVMKKSLQVMAQWFDTHIFSIAYEESLSKKERLIKMSDTLFLAFTKNRGGCFFANTILETLQVEDTFREELSFFFKKFEKALQHLYEERYSGSELEDIVQQSIADIEGSIIIMQLKKEDKLLRSALDRGIARL